MKVWINWETKEILSGPSCVYNRIFDIESEFFSSDLFLEKFLADRKISAAKLFRLAQTDREFLVDDFIKACKQRAVEEFERDFEQVEIPSEQDW